MCELPADVIVDILSRLPVKPLLKFRFVSKPWCALIDSPSFIKSHLNRSIETKTNRSIICRDCDLYSIDFDSLDHAVELDHPLKKSRWRSYPSRRLSSRVDSAFASSLFMGLDFPYYLRYKREHAMVVNGALHWLVSRRPESDKANLIAAFDLGVEEYRLVPLPELLDQNVHMNLKDFGGCLSLLCNYFEVRVEIWVMEEYGVKESWTKLFSVTQPSMIRSFDYVRPLDYSRSGGEILLEQDGKKLVWYDLERKTVKNVRIHGLDHLIEPYICVASLVPLRGGDGEMDGKKEQLQKKRRRK
ncbi:F-box protein CPR1-like [Cornus florida]|uniref:F-box protein CPR1-like n=1 Tax=Cornus florida TaxID=4283 RepID=UPI0028979AEF|nr:F-box protein CPR1-like [Cornus florida]